MLKTELTSVKGMIWSGENQLKEGVLTLAQSRFKNISFDKKKWLDPSCLDFKQHIILPGFIDLHVNGIGECDLFCDPLHSLEKFSHAMAKRGVTSFLPTLITTPVKELQKKILEIAPALKKDFSGAKPLGLHLEGPFIEPKRKGAHSKKAIETFSEKKLKQILIAGKGAIQMMTLAPEKDVRGKGIALLKKFGVKPAMGHSDATYAQGIAAIQKGYGYATHLFNAMRPWHHREPGLAGAALTDPTVYCECLPDGSHVAYPVLDMVFSFKEKNKLILSSDEWVGYSEKLKLGWVRHAGAYTDLKSGGLVGSATSLLEGIKKWAHVSKRKWTDLIPLVTINTSEFLGLSHKIGSIEKGKRADFIVVTEDLDLRMTVVGGEIVYSHPALKN